MLQQNWFGKFTNLVPVLMIFVPVTSAKDQDQFTSAALVFDRGLDLRQKVDECSRVVDVLSVGTDAGSIGQAGPHCNMDFGEPNLARQS